jgi:uncharacterized protein
LRSLDQAGERSAMQQKKIAFTSGAFQLEGRLLLPGETAPGLLPGVVLCHPHPLYGGSMNNNVTHAVSRALAGKGMAALLFNFRGVGSSEGAYDHGRGEMEDALAAVSYLSGCDELDRDRLGLMGYSFGGTIALAAGMRDNTVKAVAAVSPPEMPELVGTKPRLVICGSEDTLVSASGIVKEKERIIGDGVGSVEIIEGADHFWGGNEGQLAELIVAFFARKLIRSPII